MQRVDGGMINCGGGGSDGGGEDPIYPNAVTVGSGRAGKLRPRSLGRRTRRVIGAARGLSNE